MFAAGKLEEYEEWMCLLDTIKVFGLVDFTFNADDMIKGDNG
jgi:hypothetical protein